MNQFRLPIWSPRLLWKLTLAYTLVTVLLTALLNLLVNLVAIILFLVPFYSEKFPGQLARATREAATLFTAYLPVSKAGHQPLLLILQRFTFEADISVEKEGTEFLFRPGFKSTLDPQNYWEKRITYAVVTDAVGNVIATNSEKEIRTGDSLLSQLGPEERTVLAAALKGETDDSQLVIRTRKTEIYAAAPILDSQTGKLLGVFLVKIYLAVDWDLFAGFINDVIPGLFVTGIFGVIVGLSFGLFVARSLTRRLHTIAETADAWSQGTFSVLAPESPKDEMGLLGQRLNQMASQLQQFIILRQHLATSEERNRLARDLHDTVKQRAFALSMQIGATQALLEHNTSAAQKRLAEAEKLAYQIQQELVTIIEELRPNASRNLDLVARLREVINDWSRQSGIQAELRPAAVPSLPPAIESELLSILHEALANASRHSQAKCVSVKLAAASVNGRSHHSRITLMIADDGCGFDVNLEYGGMGLGNMRQRAALLPEGTCKIVSQPGSGTCVEVSCIVADDINSQGRGGK